MVNTYINIVTFILTTVFYYLMLKPNLSYDTLVDVTKYEEYSKKNYLYLGIYLVLVIGIQIVVNASVISTICGGKRESISENIAAVGLLTIIPGILIFGVMIIILIMYPSFKSAFSDIIGFFYISNSAKNILTELLLNEDEETISESNLSSSETEEERNSISNVISKITENTSLLINQIVPENFENYWKILNPLMKPQYKDNNLQETTIIRDQLFELIVTKDNIGESLWYIYTGILLIAIVKFNIVTRGCNKNNKMEKNIDFFKEAKAKAEAKSKEQAKAKAKAESKNKKNTPGTDI